MIPRTLHILAPALCFSYVAFMPLATVAASEGTETCYTCHEDRTLVSESDKGKSLFVDRAKYEYSVHAKLNCVDCHVDADVEDFPHEPKLKPARCEKCHAVEVKDYANSRHRDAINKKVPGAPDCAACHGTHTMLASRDVNSPTYVLNINRACLECHGDKSKPASEDAGFADKIHGRGTKKNLTVTAVCTNCHNSHDVLRHTDRNSPTSRGRLASTCSVCHAKIEDLHAKVLSSDITRPGPGAMPECSGCHSLHEKRKVFPDETFTDAYCMNCHDSHATGVADSLRIVQGEVDSSAHRNLHCIECHTTVSRMREPVCAGSDPVNCAACHSQVVEVYQRGVHGQLRAQGDTTAPGCVGCHGTHATRSKSDVEATTYRLKVVELCGSCHRRGGKGETRSPEAKGMWERYAQSTHGKGAMESGLLVAAICTDCHSTHEERRGSDSLSTVNPSHIVQTCSQCHKGIAEKFAKSVHSAAVTKTEKRLPGCGDCHPSHDIKRVDQEDFRTETLQECGKCHKEVAETYFDTYHGKKSRLGMGHAAKCSDCHGSHSIQVPSDSSSTLSPGHIVEMCKQCHPNANKGFAAYLPHATHTDPKKYPLLFFAFWGMTALLLGTFGFFGLHTLLWMPRALRERLRHRQPTLESAGPWVRRFSPYYRVLHVFVVVSFLGLALTGMALKFYDQAWASWISLLLGGVAANGLIHRLCAIVTFGYFLAHIVELIVRIRREKHNVIDFIFIRDSMIPTLRDLSEFIGSVKWFIGRGPKPEYGRWTYWEKFDYFAVFWGVAMIGVTGMILWFPEQFAAFLPGWIINIATIIHSDEALLATGFIFTIHFFNTHFRPDKFPMDMAIFTGKVPLEVFKEERPREYAQLKASNRLEASFEPPPSARMLLVSRIFGTTALCIGLALAALIIWSLSRSLF